MAAIKATAVSLNNKSFTFKARFGYLAYLWWNRTNYSRNVQNSWLISCQVVEKRAYAKYIPSDNHNFSKKFLIPKAKAMIVMTRGVIL